MIKFVALHDKRLRGGVPARSSLRVVNTDGTTSLVNAFHVVRHIAVHGPVSALFVLCHGYAGQDKRALLSVDAGGMGLQLGRENLTQSNVSLWKSIRGKIQNIVVYACAAADTEPGNAGTAADGRYLMGALAIHTDANVYAADRIQWYFRHGGLRTGRFEFDPWEGQLWQFSPSGAPPRPVPRAAVELSEVMSGAAR